MQDSERVDQYAAGDIDDSNRDLLTDGIKIVRLVAVDDFISRRMKLHCFAMFASVLLLFFFDEVDFVQTQNLQMDVLWLFLPVGYLLTIAVETPILLVGLASKLSFRQKMLCGIWLTACTYPIVVLVLPALFFGMPRWQYLTVAEILAPVAECVIFWLAFRSKDLLVGSDWLRSFAAIVVANLASFAAGEVFNYFSWFGLF